MTRAPDPYRTIIEERIAEVRKEQPGAVIWNEGNIELPSLAGQTYDPFWKRHEPVIIDNDPIVAQRLAKHGHMKFNPNPSPMDLGIDDFIDYRDDEQVRDRMISNTISGGPHKRRGFRNLWSNYIYDKHNLGSSFVRADQRNHSLSLKSHGIWPTVVDDKHDDDLPHPDLPNTPNKLTSVYVFDGQWKLVSINLANFADLHYVPAITKYGRVMPKHEYDKDTSWENKQGEYLGRAKYFQQQRNYAGLLEAP